LNINNLYNNKLQQYGEDDFRSLYWGDSKGESAKKRYKQISQYIDLKQSNILEVGCGFGSFFKLGFDCKSYVGYDINKKFIDIASKKYPNKKWVTKLPNNEFYFDACICSGVAGNRGGPAWNPNLLKKFLKKLYKLSNKTFINFPSNRSDIRSEYVEYFSPEYVLSEALNITPNTTIIHKHRFDFLLILEHE